MEIMTDSEQFPAAISRRINISWKKKVHWARTQNIVIIRNLNLRKEGIIVYIKPVLPLDKSSGIT